MRRPAAAGADGRRSARASDADGLPATRTAACLRLAAAAAASVALHAALLAAGIWHGAASWRAGAPPAHAMQVRLLAPAVDGPAAPQAVAARGADSSSGSPPEPAAPQAPAALQSDATPESGAVPEYGATPAPGAAPPPTIPEGFVPRRLLTRAPLPLAEIVPVVPPDAGARGRQRGVFTLFIDERGRVVRMVADGPELPPLFEAAARQAFEAARFAPGEVDGRAVKSLLRIEVNFDELRLRAGRPPQAPARAD